MPTTLTKAHDLIMKVRPAADAPLTKWLQFREFAARVYTEVADIDRHHHHEAMAWAGIERERAAELRAGKPNRTDISRC